MKHSTTTHSQICIAGAHRSGTSMVTRLLHICGLYLGPQNDLMPARADNPDGFWENLRFVALNDELLNQLGGAWDLPPVDEDFKHRRLDALRTKAQRLIDEFDPANTWGWKDPRNSLTWRFWKSFLPSLKTLIVVRNPLEVAYSMHKRNGTSYAFGLRLWEVYNRRLLEATNASDRLVTHYDAFFENPEKELQRIAQFAGLDSAGIGNAVALVARDRRHTHFSPEQLVEARISPQLLDLFRQLTIEAGRADEAKELSISRDYAIKQADDQFIAGAANRLDVSIPDNEPLRRELAELRGTKIQLTRAVDELRGHVSRLDQELAFVRERFTQTNELLRRKSIDLAESEARAGELSINLRRHLHLTKRLLRLVDDFKEATFRLRSSRRWKIANPIAALRAMFTGGPLPGYGHLQKVVSQYAHWRSAHPELADIDDAIHQCSLSPKTKNTAAIFEPRAPTRPIEFSQHDEVDVSIIIPVYNQIRFTESCLASIQEHSDNDRFEVIVVDDGSTDATPEIIGKVPGVVYVPNEQNVGFIASCNRGAKVARGNYLLFLNNDTVVTAGWLNSLLETFLLEPRAGVVGSKLVYPDGRLQEAGAIIWRDGSGWNRGKFDDPEKPEYNFLREVDYCSGACLMIKKSLFQKLGGFDMKYAPGYYEDADLAFRVQSEGWKAFYQPLSTVIHFEGATGGTDLTAGAKKHQTTNRDTFCESWAAVLANKPANGDLVSYEELPAGAQRILVIDHHLPMTDRDAGSLRMFHILRILHGLGHRVTFVPDNLADIPPYGDELRKRGAEVIHHPFARTVRQYLQEQGAKFDVVVLSRCDFAQKHVADVRRYAAQSRIIFDTVDLHFLRQHREAELTQDTAIKLRAEERERQEYELIDQCDETWVVSSFECELLRRERPEKSIQVVPTIVDVPGSVTPFGLRRDFLFIGGFQHTPNIDAVLYFAHEIYPLVKRRLPQARFYIIGDKAPPEVVALAHEHIIITGLQRDVRPYFESAKLSVAPLRYGAGVKGKINLSMGFGVPVVATSLAVEGMDLKNREDILIADTPEDFAAAVIDLHESESLWQRVSQTGVKKTKALYSIEAATKQLSWLLSDDHLLTRPAQSTAQPSLASTREERIAISHDRAT